MAIRHLCGKSMPWEKKKIELRFVAIATSPGVNTPTHSGQCHNTHKGFWNAELGREELSQPPQAEAHQLQQTFVGGAGGAGEK